MINDTGNQFFFLFTFFLLLFYAVCMAFLIQFLSLIKYIVGVYASLGMRRS